MEYAWNTSWGVSTRMVGGLVMTHGDDNGLRIPPKLAPTEVVIVPIWKSDEERARLLEAAHQVKQALTSWGGHVDAREGMKPGAKYYEWELVGVPLRLEIGPRDLANGACMAARRDTREKSSLPLSGLPEAIASLLATIQGDMLRAALERREANSIRETISYGRFKEIMEGDGAFVYAGWNGDPAVEAQVKEETKATIRCIPEPEFVTQGAATTCMVTGEPAKHTVIWAKAY
jgi:prolyl-tRNA synthetase